MLNIDGCCEENVKRVGFDELIRNLWEVIFWIYEISRRSYID